LIGQSSKAVAARLDGGVLSLQEAVNDVHIAYFTRISAEKIAF